MLSASRYGPKGDFRRRQRRPVAVCLIDPPSAVQPKELGTLAYESIDAATQGGRVGPAPPRRTFPKCPRGHAVCVNESGCSDPLFSLNSIEPLAGRATATNPVAIASFHLYEVHQCARLNTIDLLFIPT